MGPAAVDDVLGDLVERSVLLVDAGRVGRRFRLLETIREFAAEQLSADDDAVLIAGRHTQWCLQQVSQIHWLLVGPAEAQGVARLADFGALAARTLVTDAAAQVAASAESLADQNMSPEPRLDARHALTYMRDVLDELDVPIHLPPG